jgi:hypothetical protein
LNRADIEFFNTLSKDAQLSAESITALDVQNPELLEQLEQQAPPSVTVKTEKADIEVPKDFLKRADTHPMKIVVLLKTKYNDDWVEWLPETLWEAIRRDIGPISDVSQNKIQALAIALATNSPWQDWTTFENCGRAFNDTIPVFGQLQPLSPAETAFTVAVLKKLNSYEFSDEVLGYIGSVCLYNGIIHAPAKWFSRAQKFIDKQNKSPELVDEIKTAWKVAEKEDLLGVEFNDSKPVDVHVAKLWAIQEYLRDKAAQLKEA